MATSHWKAFRHKADHSVIYEVREVEKGYEVRRPSSGAIPGPAGFFPEEEFEMVYEPVPEEDEGNREDT